MEPQDPASEAQASSSEVTKAPEALAAPEVAVEASPASVEAPELITSVPGMLESAPDVPVQAPEIITSVPGLSEEPEDSQIDSSRIVQVEATPQLIANQAKGEQNAAIATAAAESVAAASAARQEMPLPPLGPNAIEAPPFQVSPEVTAVTPASLEAPII